MIGPTQTGTIIATIWPAVAPGPTTLAVVRLTLPPVHVARESWLTIVAANRSDPRAQVCRTELAQDDFLDLATSVVDRIWRRGLADARH